MKNLTLTLLLALASTNAFAANGSSVRGGGKVIACRDDRGNLQSVELLDLWEANKLFNRNIQETNQPVAEQAHKAILRLKNVNNFLPSMTTLPNLAPEEKVAAGTWWQTRPFLTEENKEIKRLSGVALAPTEDSFEVIRPQKPGCQVEQAVVYEDRMGQRPEILVNQDLYEKMSPTHQAALIVHEALYSYLRMVGGDTDSIRTRRTVGYVFAGLTFPSLSKILPKKHITCYAEKSDSPYRVPFLFIFEGASPDELFVARSQDLRPRAILGYFPALATLGLNRTVDEDTRKDILKNLFSEKLCDAPYMKNPSQVISGFLTMPGTGPADYDRANSVNFACLADGTRVLQLLQADRTNPDGTSKSTPLYCEENQ